MGQEVSTNTFKSSNIEYFFNARFYNMSSDAGEKFNVVLDVRDVEEFTYESKLNGLIVEAHLKYLDRYSFIDRMIGSFDACVDVVFAHVLRKSDGSADEVGIDDEHRLEMTFLVKNFKPISRSGTNIQYQIDLVSENWLNCIANVNFTNYKDEASTPFDIIVRCMQMNGLTVDESFSKVKTDVKFHYITKRNDTLFTAFQYLMNKLYWMPVKDDALKFVMYDMFMKKYRLVDISKANTLVGTFTTVLSFFKSNVETLIQDYPTNFGSFAESCSRLDLYKTLFSHAMYGYDYSKNEFINYQIDQKSTLNYANSRLDSGDYVLKYKPFDGMSRLNYFKDQSYWNNSLDIYNDMFNNVNQIDAVILNITGDILRQPGAQLNVAIDRDVGALQSDSKTEYEDMMKKYRSYEGEWFISKIINIVSPSKQSYRQNVSLFRNFLPNKKAEKAVEYGKS